MPTIEIRLIGDPADVQPMQVRGRLLNVLMRYEKQMKHMLETTTMSWNHQVEWDSDIGYAGGEIFCQVTNDSEIWGYLDGGTSERWAVMSDPFIGKTQVRSFYSGIGEGEAVLRGKGIMTSLGLAAREGITARAWSTAVMELYEDNFMAEVSEAILDGLQAAGWI